MIEDLFRFFLLISRTLAALVFDMPTDGVAVEWHRLLPCSYRYNSMHLHYLYERDMIFPTVQYVSEQQLLPLEGSSV